MKTKAVPFLLPVLLLVFSCAHVPGAYEAGGDSWREGSAALYPKGGNFQVMGGITSLNDVVIKRRSDADPSVIAKTDLDWLPVVGFAAQAPVIGEETNIGFEGGVLFSWWLEDVHATGIDDVIRLSVDNFLLLFDFFFGGSVSVNLLDRFRVYAGAGPSLMYGFANIEIDEEVSGSDTESRDETDHEFGFGYYVRTGLEFRMSEDVFFGVCVRWIDQKLDFHDTFGRLDIEGIQALVTITVQF